MRQCIAGKAPVWSHPEGTSDSPHPLTPTPLVCAAHGFLRITEWFSFLRADGRLCQFSTLEESQISSDLEYSQMSDMM